LSVKGACEGNGPGGQLPEGNVPDSDRFQASKWNPEVHFLESMHEIPSIKRRLLSQKKSLEKCGGSVISWGE
jgi:hypothetical protein